MVNRQRTHCGERGSQNPNSRCNLQISVGQYTLVNRGLPPRRRTPLPRWSLEDEFVYLTEEWRWQPTADICNQYPQEDAVRGCKESDEYLERVGQLSVML